MNTVFQKGARVLFYGDSITDAGRSRTVDTEWGRGYAARTARAYQALLPEQEIVFLNRGISGNTSADLLTRYEQDVLAIQPDFVSVMIGINDTWHGWNEGHVIPHETTQANVRELLGRNTQRYCRRPRSLYWSPICWIRIRKRSAGMKTSSPNARGSARSDRRWRIIISICRNCLQNT